MARVEEDRRYGPAGWFGIKWRIDDWSHRVIQTRSHRLHRILFGWLCDGIDKELTREDG